MAVCSGITYDSGNNIITVEFVSGDVHGDSFNNPYTFQDIYDTDQDEGWGVFSKYGNTHISNAAIYINGVDTYFVDGAFLLTFEGHISENYLFISEGNTKIEDSSREPAIIKVGVVTTDGFGTRALCDNIFYSKNIQFVDFGFLYMYAGTYDNIVINGANNQIRGSVIIRNIFMPKGATGLSILSQPDTLENINIIENNRGLDLYKGATIEGINLKDCDNDFRFRTGNTFDIYLVNSRGDITSYDIQGTSTGIMTLSLQNRFQIYIENAANASATLKDQNGNEIISGTLDSEGKWLLTDPVTWVQRYLETSGGELVENQLNYYEPFTLEVKKAGYQDLTIPNIYSSIYDSEKDKRIGSLEDTVVEGQMAKPQYINSTIHGKITTPVIEGTIDKQKVKGSITSIKI